jgi:RNA polymerase sigma-70 factor (ECF subfamily)
VWRHAATYRSDQAKVSTWLIAITRHHAIDILRWQNSRPAVSTLKWEDLSVQKGSISHNVEEQVDSALQREKIQNALEQLPNDQREALVLAYFKGYTQSQISEALQEPLGTIKTRIRLAMQKLVKLLQDD